jgi:pimeloyl-ACP methyl ester carboxylesterase
VWAGREEDAVVSTDVVVVLPGITGSTLGLREGDRPASQKLIWAVDAGAIWRGATGLGPSIKDFALPAGIGDEHPGDGVEPVGLMGDVHVIPGLWTPIRAYDTLPAHLRKLGYDEAKGNLVLFPYDWRLSNRYNGARLASTVAPVLERWRAQGGEFADAKLVLIGHSMGGLVSRWFLEQCGGAEITRKLITLGTPWRGSCDAVANLVNGVRKEIGPISLDLTAFARSMPSLYQLLPEYACVDTGADFAKTTETSVPELDSAMMADAMAFHTTLQERERARTGALEDTHMIVGTRQPTATTVRFVDGRAEVFQDFRGQNDFGDATVPLAGAVGLDQELDTNRIVRVAENHGNLQNNAPVLDEVTEILGARSTRPRLLAPVELRVGLPKLVLTTETLPVDVTVEGEPAPAVTVTVRDEQGRVVARRRPRLRDGHAEARIKQLEHGLHTVTVAGPRGSDVLPVTAATLVWRPQ